MLCRCSRWRRAWRELNLRRECVSSPRDQLLHVFANDVRDVDDSMLPSTLLQPQGPRAHLDRVHVIRPVQHVQHRRRDTAHQLRLNIAPSATQ